MTGEKSTRGKRCIEDLEGQRVEYQRVGGRLITGHRDCDIEPGGRASADVSPHSKT